MLTESSTLSLMCYYSENQLRVGSSGNTGCTQCVWEARHAYHLSLLGASAVSDQRPLQGLSWPLHFWGALHLPTPWVYLHIWAAHSELVAHCVQSSFIKHTRKAGMEDGDLQCQFVSPHCPHLKSIPLYRWHSDSSGPAEHGLKCADCSVLDQSLAHSGCLARVQSGVFESCLAGEVHLLPCWGGTDSPCSRWAQDAPSDLGQTCTLILRFGPFGQLIRRWLGLLRARP